MSMLPNLILLVFLFLASCLLGLIFWVIIECIIWPIFLDNILWRGYSHSFLCRRFMRRDERVSKICFDICDAAVNKGFKLVYPRIMITKPWVRPVLFEGVAYSENIIAINGASLKKWSDSELSAVIAHEVGHLIDFQTKRKGHPFFIPEIKALEAEKFAWAIAAYITSSEVVDNFFENLYNF